MPKSNYGQMRKQREAARRARQQKKLDRRQARVTDTASSGDGPAPTPVVAEGSADDQSHS